MFDWIEKMVAALEEVAAAILPQIDHEPLGWSPIDELKERTRVIAERAVTAKVDIYGLRVREMSEPELLHWFLAEQRFAG